MSHGAGGKATQSLIEGLLAPAFGLEELADAGEVPGNDLRITTERFVVRPIRFPALDRRAGGERDGQRPGRGRRARWR